MNINIGQMLASAINMTEDYLPLLGHQVLVRAKDFIPYAHDDRSERAACMDLTVKE